MNDNYTKGILTIIAIGIWMIVLQNSGSVSVQKVEVTNSPNVNVENEVEVDLRHINGWNAANNYSYKIDGEEFHTLGVTIHR